MREALSAALAAAVAGWAVGAMAAEPARKPAAEPPQVQVNLKIAEFDEKDRPEIDRAIRTSRGLAGGIDEKTVRSLEERKLLRAVTSPTIRTPSGSTASVSYEHGEGRGRNGKIQPVTHEIAVTPQVVSGNEPTIVANIRCRETIGKGDEQSMKEIDTGAKFKPGETFAIHFNHRPLAASENVPGAGVGNLLFVTATIQKPKPAGDTYPDPRIGNQALQAKQQNR